MKKGEKKAFLWIGITVVAVAAVTITMETQHQDLQLIKKADVLTSDSKNTASMHKHGNKNGNVTTNIPTGINPDGLPDAESRGATVLTLYCAQCHELPPPAMHTQTEWPKVVNRMKTLMQARRGGMLMRLITPPEKDWTILKTYLETHAQIPLDKKQTSGLNTPAGKAFQETCSQCHGAPNPGSHTSSEWPRAVLRMKSHILRTGKKMPSQDKLMRIIEYLQEHSKTT